MPRLVLKLSRNTRPISYLGLPALSVPCGFNKAGLPIAFQLIGRPFSEQSSVILVLHIKMLQIGTIRYPTYSDKSYKTRFPNFLTADSESVRPRPGASFKVNHPLSI